MGSRGAVFLRVGSATTLLRSVGYYREALGFLRLGPISRVFSLRVFSSYGCSVSFFIVASGVSNSVRSLFYSVCEVRRGLLHYLLEFFVVTVHREFSYQTSFPLCAEFYRLFTFLICGSCSSSQRYLANQCFFAILVLSLGQGVHAITDGLYQSVRICGLYFQRFFLPSARLFYQRYFSTRRGPFC